MHMCLHVPPLGRALALRSGPYAMSSTTRATTSTNAACSARPRAIRTPGSILEPARRSPVGWQRRTPPGNPSWARQCLQLSARLTRPSCTACTSIAAESRAACTCDWTQKVAPALRPTGPSDAILCDVRAGAFFLNMHDCSGEPLKRCAPDHRCSPAGSIMGETTPARHVVRRWQGAANVLSASARA